MVVRHAIAEERDAGRFPDDALRPLSAAGAERFARAARGLAPARAGGRARAREPVHAGVGDGRDPRARGRLAGARAVQRRSRRSAPRATRWPRSPRVRERSVAVVGHEPQLSELASLLLAGDESAVRLELKKGAAVLLACPGGPRPGRAVLRWSAAPRLLRALA